MITQFSISSKVILSLLSQRHFIVGGSIRRLRNGIKHYKGVEPKCSDSIRAEVARVHWMSLSKTVAAKHKNNDVYLCQSETNSLARKFQGMPTSLTTGLGNSFLHLNKIYLSEI